MHFEAALNLLWVSLGLLALAITARNTLARRSSHAGAQALPRRGASPWLHMVGVGLIVIALFPYISASDDVLRIEHFNAQQHKSNQDQQNRTNNLIRLYDTIDAPLVCAVREISLILFFVALVFTPAPRLLERIQPQQAGRSPPALA